jgi:hypothetical protein
MILLLFLLFGIMMPSAFSAEIRVHLELIAALVIIETPLEFESLEFSGS